MSKVADHLADIDFRTWDERHKNAVDDFIDWYNQLHEYQSRHDYDDRIQAQITVLSSVLWYLLPPKQYKKLTKHH